MTTLQKEEAWQQQLEQSKLVGIAFLDAEGQLMTRLENDPFLREAILDAQAERVRQLRLSECTIIGCSPVTYPNLDA